MLKKPNIEILDTGIDLKNTRKYIVHNKSHLTSSEVFKRCYMLLENIDYNLLKERQINGYEFNDGTYAEIIQNKTCRTIVICNSNYRKQITF